MDLPHFLLMSPKILVRQDLLKNHSFFLHPTQNGDRVFCLGRSAIPNFRCSTLVQGVHISPPTLGSTSQSQGLLSLSGELELHRLLSHPFEARSRWHIFQF